MLKRNLFPGLSVFMLGLVTFQTAGSHALEGKILLEEEIVIERGPGGRSFQRLTSVAYDRSRNEIVIIDSEANRAYISDRHGEFTAILGRGEELEQPVGVAVDAKGVIYISERNSARIKIFHGEAGRMSGTYTELILPVENKVAVSPGKMAIGPGGKIFVVDEENGWILVFDSERDFLYRIGRSGKKGKSFDTIEDVACDPRGIVYSAGRGMNPLNEYDAEGQFIQSIHDLRSDIEEVVNPVGIAVDSRNRLWVLDGTRESISIYGQAGELSQTIEKENIPGGMFLPVDIDFDGFDNLLLLEQGAGRIRIFSQRY